MKQYVFEYSPKKRGPKPLLSTLLRKRRSELGLNKFAISKKMGISVTHVSYLEDGRTNDPKLSTVLKIMKVYKLTFWQVSNTRRKS